jgi:solute carrier family 25 carnitine/acylcarnitine transporter 20/29
MFLAGAVSGMCGLTLSHPFDTIKTHIQNNKKININPINLYRGLLPPLLGIGIEKAFVFGTYNLTNKHFNTFTSGCIAGLSASVVVTPYERLKTLLQMNNKITNINLKFLYTGFSATLTREIPGFGIYFSVYENGKKYFYHNNITTSGSFLLGGLSGAIAWIFIYPQDIIKTKIQSSLTNYKIKDLIHNIYSSGGIKQFYKGFHLALLRAIPLHAGTFCTMEYLQKKFIQNK